MTKVNEITKGIKEHFKVGYSLYPKGATVKVTENGVEAIIEDIIHNTEHLRHLGQEDRVSYDLWVKFPNGSRKLVDAEKCEVVT